MIDVFIGTKAQYIKTAPVLRLLSARGVAYRLIDSGQHARTAASLRAFLGVKEPDIALQNSGNINTIGQAAHWFLRNAAGALFARNRWLREVFSPGPGLCIIHGDTPSTLLGLFMAKRAGKRILHLEAGLRSFNLLRPFPEELIRVLCMWFSDVLVAPSHWAAENLRRMRVRGRVVEIDQNTNVEALYYALERKGVVEKPREPYCVVTFHRVETIMHRPRVRFVLDVIRKAAQARRVVFVQHEPTMKKLADFGLAEALGDLTRVTQLPLQSHADFVALLDGADFVITDGGSIQEECTYLDTPCLVMRTETERREGIGGVVRLADFDQAQVEDFLENFAAMRTGQRAPNLHAAERVCDVLLEMSQECATNPSGASDARTSAV